MALSDFNPQYLVVEQRGDVIVAGYTVEHLTDEDNIEQLGHEMFALVEKHGFHRIVLCLDEVEYVTSSVLGKMISLHRKLHRQDGMLVLCGVRESVRQVLRRSRLLDYFNLADDAESAMSLLY